MSDETLTALLEELIHADELPDWSPLLPGRLSASQAAMFERCPEQYRRVYLLGERQPPSGAMIWGRADHQAHQANFAQKIHSWEDLALDEVQDAFSDSFEREIDEAGGISEVEWKEPPAKTKDLGQRLVAVYHEQVSPALQPIAVEERFELEIPGTPVPVIGYTDVELADSLVERKTTRQAERQPKPQWRQQGLTYQAAKEKEIAWHVGYAYETPKTAKSVVGVNTPADAPALRLERYDGIAPLVERMYRTLAASLLAYIERFGPDEPWPGATSHPWACGFCGFRPTCPWWAWGSPEFGDDIPF